MRILLFYSEHSRRKGLFTPGSCLCTVISHFLWNTLHYYVRGKRFIVFSLKPEKSRYSIAIIAGIQCILSGQSVVASEKSPSSLM